VGHFPFIWQSEVLRCYIPWLPALSCLLLHKMLRDGHCHSCLWAWWPAEHAGDVQVCKEEKGSRLHAASLISGRQSARVKVI